MGRFEPLLNRLDASKKERGDEFERLCQWFLENDPIYATQLEKVWLWEEWPDRWGPDGGIKLVARTKQGEFWAIQAKHYAPESTVLNVRCAESPRSRLQLERNSSQNL